MDYDFMNHTFYMFYTHDRCFIRSKLHNQPAVCQAFEVSVAEPHNFRGFVPWKNGRFFCMFLYVFLYKNY